MRAFLTEWVLRHGDARVPPQDRRWTIGADNFTHQSMSLLTRAFRGGYLGFETVGDVAYRWITEKGKQFLERNDEDVSN